LPVSRAPTAYLSLSCFLNPDYLSLFLIANDDEDGGAGGDDNVSVVDIVDAFKLKEINITKPEFVAYIKRKPQLSFLSFSVEYLPKVKAKLTEAGKADRVPTFQKGAAAFVKHVIEKFDEIQIYVGDSYDMEGAYTYCYYKEQTDDGPTFFYFHDGLKEEKF
jgi:hypothetical protein